MFLSTILLALIVGALAGGGVPRLAELRLRWVWLLLLALGLRLAATWGGREMGLIGGPAVGTAIIGGYALIFVWLSLNWRVPGLQVASVGIAANGLAVVLHGGQMPIWSGAFLAAGFTAADLASDPFHFVLQTDTVAGFVAAGGLFGDVIPIPLPIVRDVVSIGDLVLAIGIFWAIVYSMTRPEAPGRETRAVGVSPAMAGAGAAGGAATFQAGVAYTGMAGAAVVPAEPAARREMGLRGQSPYLRLVRNRNFSLLWIGQLISLLGDRIHIIALAALVGTRGTPLELGITFAATAVPNVVLGPLAGVLVDRWDRRATMIGCDLVRAGLVLTVPYAFEIDIRLVYVAAFLIATVTLLFRPAKTAVIPAIVDDRDLVTANSASSVSDTAADLLGYPIAGLIVTALSSLLGAAFVLDAATYVVSGVLVWAMIVPRQVDASTPISVGAVWREMREGFAFLWHKTELLANTLLSTVGQVAVGAVIVVAILYAQDVLDRRIIDFPNNYSLLLTAEALGSVAGGLTIGAIGSRIAKGPVMITGFVAMGLALVAAGLVTSPYLAIGIFFVIGLANMLFIVPTITLFQEQTPQRLMGRVVSSRQALVFGAIAASMALSGWLSEVIGPALVLVAAGGICAAAGAVGALFPSVREAR